MMLLLLGQLRSHFFLRKLTSTKMPSVVLASDDKSLSGMFSGTYTRIPPPNLSQSKRKGVQNPGILNLASGNDSSLPETCSTRASR